MTISIKERKAYGFPSPLQKLNPPPIIAQRAPKTSDTGYRIGQVWIDKPNNDSYILTSISTNQAQWQITTISVTENAPISKYIVDADGSAGYTTVQSALDAANAAGGGIVYIRPGTYTEDLICYDKTQVVGAVGLGDTDDLRIIGRHTPPTSGGFTFRNIKLESLSDIFYTASPGNATLIIIDCNIKVTSGFTFNLNGWLGTLMAFNLTDTSTITNGGVNNGNGATIFFSNSTIGAGTTNSFKTTGPTTLYNCIINSPIRFDNNTIGVASGGCQFKKNIDFVGSGELKIYNSLIGPGSMRLNHASGSEITLSDVTIDSTAANPIIGSGIIRIANVNFPTNGGIVGTVIVRNDGSSLFGRIRISETGANTSMGVATLVAGTVTVNTIRAGANSRIYLTHQNNSGTLGFVTVSARVPNTSFTITSSSATDTSDIAWLIVEPQ